MNDDLLSALLMGSTWWERNNVGLRERTWEDMSEEERKIAMDVLRKKIPLLAAVMEYGAPLNEAEQAEAKKKYGNWQDDTMEKIDE